MSNFPGDIILPDFVLSLGTQPLSEIARDCLVGLSVHQRLSMPSQCELTFEVTGQQDRGGLVEQLRPGVGMSVTMPGRGEPLFEGTVTAVEYSYGSGDRLRILTRGYDFLYQLRQTQNVTAYNEVSLAALAREMLKSAGVTADISIQPRTSLTWPLLIQHQQNNLEFLTEIAAQEGHYLFASRKRLNLLGLSGLLTEAVPLTLGDNLLEADLEINTAGVCEQVEAVGWSTKTAAVQRQVARRSQVGLLRQADPGGRAAGRMMRRFLVNEFTYLGQQALALAQADLDQSRMGENTFWGKAVGDARLYPGVPVEVRNVAAPVAGRYVITEAMHTLDFDNGYISEISTFPPEISPRPRGDIATLGLVIDNDDPEGLGRVRVELPAYGSVPTAWLPVTFPGGGAGKGFVSLPGTGDHVLVLLLRENPAEGIVLGGLYARNKPPESDISRGQARRYTWTTSDGQKIQLNENGDLVRLETHAGAAIELNGSQIVIQGSRIDFRNL